MNDRTKDIVACWWIILLVRERRKPNFPDQALCLGAEMPYEIQNRQVVEGIEVKQVLRVHDGKTLMIDKAAGSENIESEVLVWVRSALAVPLLADYSRVAIGVEDESVVRRWKDIS